jgi:hypothetical protein
MNERIRKLIRTKSAILFPGTDEVDCQITDIEKFAELIVRECARVYWNIDDGETHTEYVEALKEHFGVEE